MIVWCKYFFVAVIISTQIIILGADREIKHNVHNYIGNFFYRKSTIAAIEVNNDTYCLQKQIGKFPMIQVESKASQEPLTDVSDSLHGKILYPSVEYNWQRTLQTRKWFSLLKQFNHILTLGQIEFPSAFAKAQLNRLSDVNGNLHKPLPDTSLCSRKKIVDGFVSNKHQTDNSVTMTGLQYYRRWDLELFKIL